MSFALDAKLAADTLFVGDLPLSRVLLMNDARYDWLILVPRRADLVEITDLKSLERGRLMEEITLAVEALRPKAEKVNVGALGNIVRQLHIHVVARGLDDAAWPGPVWGVGAPRCYGAEEAAAKVEAFKQALDLSSLRAED